MSDKLYTTCHNSFVHANSKVNEVNNQIWTIEYAINNIKNIVAHKTDDEKLAKERHDILCEMLDMEKCIKEMKSNIDYSISTYDNYMKEYKQD